MSDIIVYYNINGINISLLLLTMIDGFIVHRYNTVRYISMNTCMIWIFL